MREDLFLGYGIEPPDLPTYCDVCKAKFAICHALDCKRGGLITARNDELCDMGTDLAGKAFTPSHVRNNSLIFSGWDVKRRKAMPSGDSSTTDEDRAPPTEVTDQKGDPLIRDLWQNRTNSVHDMRVVNTDAKSHTAKTPDKCLQVAERGKKRMYL